MPRASFSAWLLAAACCTATCACSGGGAAAGADAGTDPDDTETGVDLDTDSDSDGDSDTGPPIPAECPTALVPPCGDALYELPLIVAADFFGEGLKFVDATDFVIVAEREVDGETEITAIRRRSWTGLFWNNPLVATMNVGDGHVVGAAGIDWGDSEGAGCSSEVTNVLVCYEDGSCDVYEEVWFWNEDESTYGSAFEPAPTWNLPESIAAREIRPLRYGIAIVVGNGSVELLPDGDLHEFAGPDTGPALKGVSARGVAVGDAGRVSVCSEGDSAPIEIDAGTTADLLSVAAIHDPWFSAIAASDGAIGIGSPEEGFVWTAVASEPLVEIHELPDYIADGSRALTASGCVLESEESDEIYCVGGVVPEPATRVVSWICDDARNIDYLAPDGLYGYWDCYDMW